MEDTLKITGAFLPEQEQILTPEALKFLQKLHTHFNEKRLDLLKAREVRQKQLNEGILPAFLEETAHIRNDLSWKVAKTPKDLECRFVEITGPTDRKMMINALNSGADVFMADFEDANSPNWQNMIQGQLNLKEAVEGSITFDTKEGKHYHLKEKTATLFVRPRGWHLNEKHIVIAGEQISASLFDFGLFFFLNAKKLLKNGTQPYFYLPKLESHLEAKLWNQVFVFAQDELKIPQGSIRATVLIETILAAFEMEEILFALKDHSAGLNAGRWDYIFSIIKKFQNEKKAVLPDRAQVSMTVPFMRAYAKLVVKCCHKRGAHAIGGMAAFIPNRKDVSVTERALKKVQEDKQLEVKTGFDGTWVAHPDLVQVARQVFLKALPDRSHQREKLLEEVSVEVKDLMDFNIADGTITENGLRHNIDVAIQYLTAWLNGLGAVALYNLMEDTATAEISRAQLWQWLHFRVALQDGRVVNVDLIKRLIEEEFEKTAALANTTQLKKCHLRAKEIFKEIVFTKRFVPFLTQIAYQDLP